LARFRGWNCDPRRQSARLGGQFVTDGTHEDAACAVLLAALLPSIPAHGHHSFAAEFDGKNCRDFTGVLTKLDWQNPHAYFYLDVKDDGGRSESWSFQTYALITLRRAGNDRQVFIDNIGKEVFVRGCLARNGREKYAAAGTLRFADGVLRQVGQLQD
jgi:hypothetical protein